MSYSKADEKDWKYPAATMNQEGYLKVSDNPAHNIFWQEYGNPKGEPVIFLHGGPGGGATNSPEYTRFFDPKRYRIILFDQRGCGKSEPSVSVNPAQGLTNNTTSDLISDIEKLRMHLALGEKMHVFGGSWGSTLALAYAIAHPHNVQSLILRGIFLCRKKDLDYFYQGNAAFYKEEPFNADMRGTYLLYPDEWKEYVEIIPPEKRTDMIKAYSEIFLRTPQSKAEEDYQNKAVQAWTQWEGRTSYLSQDLSKLGKFDELDFAKAFAKIENHYFMNGAFLGGYGETNRDNNYLLKHIGKIAHLPIYIVHGQMDQVCPRFNADELIAALKREKANYVHAVFPVAGHAAIERENMLALTKIMDELPKM